MQHALCPRACPGGKEQQAGRPTRMPAQREGSVCSMRRARPQCRARSSQQHQASACACKDGATRLLLLPRGRAGLCSCVHTCMRCMQANQHMEQTLHAHRDAWGTHIAHTHQHVPCSCTHQHVRHLLHTHQHMGHLELLPGRATTFSLGRFLGTARRCWGVVRGLGGLQG